jgi:SARP family transcriptional regulator, regulator of embCAB operon
VLIGAQAIIPELSGGLMPAGSLTTGGDDAGVEDAVQFGVLGPLQMSIRGTLVPLGTPKQRAVLAVMVINANRPVGIDTLIDYAWDERPPEGARATLHAYVSNLRRLMRGAGIDPAVLASAPPGYRLAIADNQYDLGRFIKDKEAGVRAAAAAQFERASRHLSAALAEWRGPVLDDLRDFEFVEPFARGLDDEKVVAHTAYAEAEIACGRAYAVIKELEALTAQQSYREPLWAQLITAYYLADRQSDALDTYHRLKTTLAEDLGIDPSPTVRELYERVLRQQPLDVRKTAQSHAVDTIRWGTDKTKIRRPSGAALRDAAGQLYALGGTATRIGRSPENDIVLPDLSVSRHHAVIIDNGRTLVIIDMGSANGVHVRGQRIHPEAELSEGDHIQIGDYEFTLETEPAGRPQ